MVGEGKQVPVKLLNTKIKITHQCTGQLTCFFVVGKLTPKQWVA